MELFQHTAGVELKHVPYKGGAQAITDVLGGHVEVVAVNALEVLPLVKAGKLRVLAVMSAERSGVLPGVPTVAESGYPGFEASVWYGFVAPAGLPAPLRMAAARGGAAGARTGEVREQLAAAGGVTLPGPTARFEELLRSDAARYGKLIRDRPHQARLRRSAMSCPSPSSSSSSSSRFFRSPEPAGPGACRWRSRPARWPSACSPAAPDPRHRPSPSPR